MTYISELHDYDGQPHETKVQEFLSEGRRKVIKGEIEQIFEDVADSMNKTATCGPTERLRSTARRCVLLSGQKGLGSTRAQCKAVSGLGGA